MAHEIEQWDNVALFQNAAWHGLGDVVTKEMDIWEARRISRTDYDVVQCPLEARLPDGTLMSCESRVMNVRTDVNVELGVVGADWECWQTAELCSFIETLVDDSSLLRIESAGSIRNGTKVWYLLRGETFTVDGTRVKDGDAIAEYLLCSTGFDGMTSNRFTPTGVRVVCSNTLHAVIPSYDSDTGAMSGGSKSAGFAVPHTKGMKDRLDDARDAFKQYVAAQDAHRQLINRTAARELTSDEVKAFLLECYVKDYGGIPVEPDDAKGVSKRQRAVDAVSAMAGRFYREEPIAGHNAWNAFNAYSGWLQHDRSSQQTLSIASAESALNSQLFGGTSKRTQEAFALAVTLAS